MSRKFLQITFSVLLLAGLALGFALKDGALAQDNPASKLEAGLVDQLTAGPADFIVVMAQKADLSAADQLQTKLEKGQYVFDTLTAFAAKTQADIRSYLDAQGVNYRPFYIMNAIWVKQGNLDLAQNLALRSDVASVKVNDKYQLQAPINPQVSNANPQAVEPNISFINADDVWAMGITGEGAVVAGNDTGLDATHPAIARHYRGCLNPPTCDTWDHNYNWYDVWTPSNVTPWDDYGHGTHTTGTMVGDDGAGNQIGVAPGAKTIHCKNMLYGGGDVAHFVECFEWDLAPWDLNGANPDPAMAPDSVNNSWGFGGGGIEDMRDAIDALQASGVVVEVSAGNEGSGCQSLRSPGDYEEVLTTGSVWHLVPYPGTITGFSSRGPSSLDPGFFPDIMAPGENIRSSVLYGGYEYWSGTSMAGPHATALVGLMWSANPALRGQVQQTMDIIKDTAVPLTGQGGSNCGGDYDLGPNNDWGYGTIDAQAAVAMAIAMGGAGQLDGNVTDAVTGEPIEDANVHAAHEEGFAWDAQTDATGYYTMTVAAGIFDVTASHPLYESASVSEIEVITDTVTHQDFELIPRGKLLGYVTDFDNGFALAGAVVTADDGTTATTDDLGYYEMYLDEGTITVTATMEEYAPESASVDIVSGEETQQDFALKAAVAFVPLPAEVTVDWNGTGTLDAQLLNRLPDPYAFEFREKAGGFNPIPGQKPITPEPDGAPIVPEGSSSGNAVQPYKARINQAEILVLSSTDIMGSVEQILNDEGLLYDYLWVPPVTGIDFTPYTTVIVGMDGGTFSVADIQALRVGVIDAGKRLIFMGGTCWQDFATGVNDYLVLNYTNNYCWTISSTPNWTLTDPSHGLADGLPDTYNFVGIYAGYYQIRINDPGAEVVGVNGDGWPMYFYKGDYGLGDFVWMIDSVYAWYWSDPSDYAWLKTTLLNAINYSPVSDVPWFTEVPTAGTVPAEDALDVTLYFTATHAVGVDQPGQYYASLFVKGDPKLEVPVLMNVVPPDTFGQLKGTVTDLCTGDPLEEVLVDIPTGVPITQTLTDEFGKYNIWLEEGGYNVNFSLPDYISTTHMIDIVAGEALVFDVELVPNRACITVDTNLIEAWLVTGTEEYQTDGMTIGNIGAQDLDWEILEKEGSYTSTIGSNGNAPSTVRLPATENPGTTSVLDRPQVLGIPQIEPNVPNAWAEAAPVPQQPLGIVRYAKMQCPGDYNSFYVVAGVSQGWLVWDTVRYDADTDTWTPLAPISGMVQENPTGVCYEGKLYVTSGGYYVTDFNIYDIATDSWSTGAPLPRSVEGGAMAGYDGKIYLIGGDDDFYPGSGVSDEVNIYDIASDTWVENGAPMPEGISNGGFIQLGQYVYVVGGWWQPSPGTNSNLTLRYDIEGDVWEEGPEFTPARADIPLAATIDYLYVMGGDQDGNGYWDSSNVVWRYDFNAWPGGAWEDAGDNLPWAIQAMNAGFTTDSVAGGEIWNVGGMEGATWTWHAENLYRVSEPPWTPVPIDVKWVWETPISGTVAPEGDQLVDVFMTAMSGTVPLPLGTYTATLRVTSNDRVAGTQDVTVVMHIVEEYVKAEPMFTATTPVNVGEEMAFTNETTPGIPPDTEFLWDFGDGVTMTVNTWDTVYHTYATFGTFTVTLTATNDAGDAVFSDDVVVLPKVLILPIVQKN